jgi:hypothetical protein
MVGLGRFELPTHGLGNREVENARFYRPLLHTFTPLWPARPPLPRQLKRKIVQGQFFKTYAYSCIMAGVGLAMFQAIKDCLREPYLEDKRPWLVGFSGGKESGMLASLVFDAVRSVPAEQRTKPVTVSSPAVKSTWKDWLNSVRHSCSIVPAQTAGLAE